MQISNIVYVAALLPAMMTIHGNQQLQSSYFLVWYDFRMLGMFNSKEQGDYKLTQPSDTLQPLRRMRDTHQACISDRAFIKDSTATDLNMVLAFTCRHVTTCVHPLKILLNMLRVQLIYTAVSTPSGLPQNLHRPPAFIHHIHPHTCLPLTPDNHSALRSA